MPDLLKGTIDYVTECTPSDSIIQDVLVWYISGQKKGAEAWRSKRVRIPQTCCYIEAEHDA